MQSTSNVAAEKTGPAKLSEKLAEKRRALGRGLESLLPGPRVVPPPAAHTLPQSARKDGGPAASSSSSSLSSSPAEFAGGRPGAAVATRAGEGERPGAAVATHAGTVLDQLQ